MVQVQAKDVVQVLAVARCNSKLATTSATSVLKAKLTDRAGDRQRGKKTWAAKTDFHYSKRRKSLLFRLRDLCCTRVCRPKGKFRVNGDKLEPLFLLPFYLSIQEISRLDFTSRKICVFLTTLGMSAFYYLLHSSHAL